MYCDSATNINDGKSTQPQLTDIGVMAGQVGINDRRIDSGVPQRGIGGLSAIG
jgi:hypothetical protein